MQFEIIESSNNNVHHICERFVLTIKHSQLNQFSINMYKTKVKCLKKETLNLEKK